MPECPEGMGCAAVMPAKYCANNDLVIQIGDTLPSELTYTEISTTSRYPSTFSLRNFMPKVQTQNGETGYGMGFAFNGVQGEMLESLVTELQTASVGSYIRTHLYDPNNRKITSADTRIDFTVSEPGTYHLIATTFGNKEGDIAVQIFDREAQKIKGTLLGQSAVEPPPFVDLPIFNQSFLKVGRSPFTLQMTFPDTAYLKENNEIEYFSKVAARTVRVRPAVYQKATEDLVRPVRFGNFPSPLPTSIYNLNENSISILPIHGSSFAPGYYYALVAHDVFNDPGVSGQSFASYFVATSTSGLLADVNNDARVNLMDYTILSQEFMAVQDLYQADLNNDGHVNLLDYTLMAAEFGAN